MKVLILLIFLFVLSSLIIINNNELRIYKDDDFNKFSDIYLNWVDTLYKNVQSIVKTGIELKWVP